MKRNKNTRIILLLVFASFFINVYTFTSLSHLFRYIPNFELFRKFNELVTYSDWMFFKRFLMYFFTSSMSGIAVFFAHKRISMLNIENSRKVTYITLTILSLTALSISLHLVFIERHGWDFDVSYEEYIFRRIMWYIGRTASMSIIALYMAYFAVQKEKEKQLETEIHQLRVSNIKNKYLVLKEQLNPNFLFNSVNTLNRLILEQPAGAKQFLNALSKLLRNSISQTEQNPVEKEIELIHCLTTVYKFGPEKGFSVRNHISSEISQKQIPTLIISNIISYSYKRHLNFHQTSSTTISLSNNDNYIFIEIESKGIMYDEEFSILCKQLSERYYVIKNSPLIIVNENNSIKLSLPL